MRAPVIISALILCGCSGGDPTAEDFARGKAYCEKHGMKAFIEPSFPPLQMHNELRCRVAEGGGGSVRVPTAGEVKP